jgi:hypothetical protein
METCTVRYPIALLAFSIGLTVIGGIAFILAAQGKGHWTFGEAVLWSVFGAMFALYFGTYRTVFTLAGVEQTGLLRRVQSYSYSEIQSVSIGKGKSTNAITMTFVDGHKMTVYGSEKQLMKAQWLLSRKLPHLTSGTV